ncbi:MAG: aromatic-ring-hydroxylating dioxygenase subunit beta [Actinomycetota bacterium]
MTNVTPPSPAFSVDGDVSRASPDGVARRYAELTAMVSAVELRPVADPAATARATLLLAREARRLDGGAFDDWLDWWTDDGVLWVPNGSPVDPAIDQSLLLDDRRRIGERIAWRRDPSAWGQHPLSTTVRVLGPVEAWVDADRTVVRSALVVHEQRRGRTETLVGHQVHELVGADLRCRSKVLIFPQLALGVRNPSFLL